MLEKEDLKLIKQVVQEVIEEDVLPHFIDVYDRFENIDQHFKSVDQHFEQVDRRFEQVDQRFEQVDQRFEQVDQRFEQVDQRFDCVDSRLTNIEINMVTKDYLEDRLADFKADLKQSGGRALRQIKKMASDLYKNGSLTAEQVVQITTA